MSDNTGEGGAAALKGLRLLTVNRGPEGYGFHMYTNKSLKGQYVKWVLPNGPADLAGMLPGDHMLEVDGVNVVEEAHHKVVERIRSGDGKEKKLLVIDKETEQEMAKREEAIDPSKALVMIARAPIKITKEDRQLQIEAPISSNGDGQVEETDGPSLPLPDMSSALPPKKGTKRAQVKNRDWRSSIQAYNEL